MSEVDAVRFLSVQPGLRVRDLDAAAALYGRLGFRPVYRNGDEHLVLEKDAVVLHLSTVEGGPGGGQILVDRVDPLFELVRSLGGSDFEVLYDGLGDRPWGCRDFTVRDPDGNRLTFSQPL